MKHFNSDLSLYCCEIWHVYLYSLIHYLNFCLKYDFLIQYNYFDIAYLGFNSEDYFESNSFKILSDNLELEILNLSLMSLCQFKFFV